jgi:hypothetical protein
MFEAGFSLDSLRATLVQLPPVELKGMVLLRQHHPVGQFFPSGLPREVVAEAVTEIVGYTQRCQCSVHQLSELAAVPLTAFAIVEYGL